MVAEMRKGRQSYEEKFDTKSREVIALIMDDGATAFRKYDSPNWEAVVDTIAYVDMETKQQIKEKKRLVWFLTDKKLHWTARFNLKISFKKQHIYRLKIREALPCEDGFGKMQPYGHEFMVEEVLERDCREPWLEAVLAEYNKTVTLDTEYIKGFVLDRGFDQYDGEGLWNGERTSVSVKVKEEGSEQVSEEALRTLQTLFENSKEWDEKTREYAADELLSLANDWYMPEDEEADDCEEMPVSREEFIRRIGVVDVLILSDGSFELYYDSDEMFTDYAVVVSGNPESGFDDANIT